ncbi:hypothetical protein PPERSA_09890 [Pseudocohnilembus persalinus]|uniref:L-ornithine N(5)-monooxygenase [NAD(P)H] n=1 Tax=Pseudocohnilembus persalinus TaxID=266149 RepID=A0A0V0QU62_PSEPJ|nr:hypothetical protein PPERSA_09890 [Pseudocohnilembus persalinus]|eukprot:KRX05750.1 hypothetical protein PPERSA_09890 [Pseudocohnilembus persalinus]
MKVIKSLEKKLSGTMVTAKKTQDLTKNYYFQKQNNQEYNLVLIGGGCSSFAFLLNAYRNNKLDELVGKKGICILEKSTKFGGGTLEDNLIPSNTHSMGVLRFLMGEHLVSPLPTQFEAYLKKDIPQLEKRPSFDLNKLDDGIMDCFKELIETEAYQHLREKREQTSSLQLFGYFLRLSANQFLRYLCEKNYKIHFRNLSECVKIVENKTGAKYEIQFKDLQSDQIKTISSQNIILSNGGHQQLNPMYRQVPQEKRILCEDFLKQAGFLRALELIEKNPDQPISVIGGSHSAFSVAYMLIYGPDYYDIDELSRNTQYAQKRNQQCVFCGQVGANCVCYGDVSVPRIKEKIKNYQCKLNKGQIKIFHRHDFRISYVNEETAIKEGYKDYDKNCIHKFEGCVNPYTGLRGLTKKLLEDVNNKIEERIEFIQFKDYSDIRETLENSSVVVECLGYYTNTIDVQKNNKEKFEYTYDIDKFVKMDQLHQVEGLQQVYGIGLGYGLQTDNELIGGEILKDKKVRADSLQVYLSRLGQKILSSLTPSPK